jgi:RHS repeat-associated protein
MGTPVARIQNRNDRTEHQFHGLGSSTLAAVESGVGIVEAGDPTPPASGTINAAFMYSPWGELIETVGSEIATHPRLLNDKYHDASSGLAYYGIRYYDQVSMMWTQQDPLYHVAPDFAGDDPRRANLYAFSLQNPNSYVDPDGLDSEPPMVPNDNPIIRIKGTAPESPADNWDARKRLTEWQKRLIRECRKGKRSVACGLGLHKQREACRKNLSSCKPKKPKKPEKGWTDHLKDAASAALDFVKEDVLAVAACALVRAGCGMVATAAKKVVGKAVGAVARLVKSKLKPWDRRVKLRKSTVEKIKANQPRNKRGRMVDPNERTELRGPSDIGHKKEHKWTNRQELHRARNSTREEVIEMENDPDLYHLENRGANRSHRYE